MSDLSGSGEEDHGLMVASWTDHVGKVMDDACGSQEVATVSFGCCGKLLVDAELELRPQYKNAVSHRRPGLLEMAAWRLGLVWTDG